MEIALNKKVIFDVIITLLQRSSIKITFLPLVQYIYTKKRPKGSLILKNYTVF